MRVPSVESLSTTMRSSEQSPCRARIVVRQAGSQCASFVETTMIARSCTCRRALAREAAGGELTCGGVDPILAVWLRTQTTSGDALLEPHDAAKPSSFRARDGSA